jgi:Methylase involved in ubiquinone/menaquinone biosynthesis
MWPDGAFIVPGDTETAAGTARLQRTRRNAFADVELALSWRSAEAAHTDVYAAFNLNLWRDWMPPEIESLLLDKPLGQTGGLKLAPGVLVPESSTRDVKGVRHHYARLIPKGARVLDIMAATNSHLDPALELSAVAGLGMNAGELAANETLGQRVVHDLNREPKLPFPDADFDAVVCTVSVEYLVRPFEVFREVARVLKRGGKFIVTFSNRWFPPKTIRIWTDLHPFERMGLVLEYFLRDGRFGNLNTFSLTGLPRPADDKYAGQMQWSDPIYSVWGETA